MCVWPNTTLLAHRASGAPGATFAYASDLQDIVIAMMLIGTVIARGKPFLMATMCE